MNQPKLQLEAGKFYKTRDGFKAFVGAENPFENTSSCKLFGFIDGRGPTTWRTDGRYYPDGSDSANDLVAEWVEPKRIKGFVAVQLIDDKNRGLGKGDEVAYTSHIYADREDVAELYNGKATAIIEIDVLEGQGLEGGQ